eukprot:jgi/Picsp_1/2846/NSC_01072-R1_hypothetical protein CHLNCDRAFT_136254 [Chlorella variabilis]
MGDNSAEEVKVIVRTVEFGTHEISLSRMANLGVLKQALETVTGVEVSRQRLLHRGRELTDESSSAESLGWRDGVVLHMVSQQPPPATRGGGTQTGRRAQAAAGPTTGPQQQGGEQQGLFDFSSLLPPDLAPAFNAFRDSLTREGVGIQGGMIGPIAVPMDGENGAGFAEQMQEMLQDALRNNTVAPPIPGDLLNGRPPPLNENGELEMGASIDVLDQMLIRLENENMEEDQVPALQETDLENFHNPEYNRNWSVAIRSFLNAARVILQDCRLNRETREVVNRALRASGLDPLPLGVRSFPVAHSASGSDDDNEEPIPMELSGSQSGRQSAQRNERAASQQPAATEEEDHSWVQNISHEDLIVVAAVAIGELTRRFMGVVGDLQSPTGVNAMILRIAERLRSMSSIRNQQETIRQMRLIIGHLSRVAVSAAELSRGLAYLTSAIDQNNMFLLQLYPGYIQMQDGLPRPNLGILHNIEAHRVMTMIPDLPGMPSMEEFSTGTTHGFMSMSIPIQVPMPGQPAPQAGSNDMPAPGPVQMQTGNSPQTGPQRPANSSGGQPPHPIPVNIQAGVPNAGGNRQPGPQARAVLIGAQRRQPQPNAANPPTSASGPIGGEDLLRILPPDLANAIRAALERINVRDVFANTMGTAPGSSVNLNDIMRDVMSAIRSGLQEAAADLRQQQAVSINALIQSALPRITSRVGQALSSHMSQFINTSNDGTTDSPPNQPEEPQADAAHAAQPNQPEETPSAQPRSSPMEGLTATDMQKESNQSEEQTEKRKVEDSSAQAAGDAKPGAAGPSQPSSGQKGPNPVGLGGGLKRRKVSTTAKEKTEDAPKDAPTMRTSEQQSSQQQAPRGTNRSTSRSSSGMQSMLNQVMQSPSLRNLLGGQDDNRNTPSLDIGSLLNTAGPMISQMLSGGPQQQHRQPGQQNVVDADGIIESEISDPKEQQRWKDALNRVDNAAAPPDRQEGLSEAYVSTIPARREGGIIESILGDE